MVIPSSAVDAIMDLWLGKADNDSKWYVQKKKRFQYFGMKPLNIIMCSCTSGHYFVISMKFNGMDTNDNFFKDVTIFDSIKRSSRTIERVKDSRHADKIPAIKFLKKFQKFVQKFIFDGMEVGKGLWNDENYILNDVRFAECPLQMNGHDCSLYALGVLLHLASSRPVNNITFNQDTISTLRKGLYKVLQENKLNGQIGNPKFFISRHFINYFFPDLYENSDVVDPFIINLKVTKLMYLWFKVTRILVLKKELLNMKNYQILRLALRNMIVIVIIIIINQ